MTTETYKRIKELAIRVIDLPPTQQQEILNKEKEKDPSLVEAVISLLKNQAEVDFFLKKPLYDVHPLIAEKNRDKADSLAPRLPILDQLIGCVLDNKYEIKKQIGRGGMGAVYLATHLGTSRQVALKVIAPELMESNEFVERFKLEAQTTGQLRHPNIVNVTDFGFTWIDTQQLAYLVMEYLDGCTLGDLIKERGRLALELVVDIVEQICLAIDKAYQHGIIHRDLKPDNIWLENNGRGGYTVKVLDFGLAKFKSTRPSLLVDSLAAINHNSMSGSWTIADADSNPTLPDTQTITDQTTQIKKRPATGAIPAQETDQQISSDTGNIDSKGVGLTGAGTIIGTPLYMSPEQCSGEDLGIGSDLYSLGVIVYQMLCGKTPFQGKMFELMVMHKNMKPPELIELRNDLPKPVATLVMSTLAKSPAERPATATAFAMALRANAEGVMPVLGQAKAIYNRYLLKFFSLSLCIYMPILLFALLLTMLNKWLLILTLPLILLANTVNVAACTLAVEKICATPSLPFQIRTILKLTVKQIDAILFTGLEAGLTTAIRTLKFVVPGIRTYCENSLYGPVIVLENRESNRALMRSKELCNRIWHLTSALQIYDLCTGIIVLAIFGHSLWLYFWSRKLSFTLPVVLSGENLFNLLPLLICPLAVSLFHSRFAIAFAILYLKAVRIANEKTTVQINDGFDWIIRPTSSSTSYKQNFLVLSSLIVRSIITFAVGMFVVILIAIILNILGVPTGAFSFSDR